MKRPLLLTLLAATLLAAAFFMYYLPAGGKALTNDSVITTNVGAWNKIQVINSTVSYVPNGTFRMTLINALGVSMSVEDLNMSDNLHPGNCSAKVYQRSAAKSAAPGNELFFVGVCPQRAPGERYNLSVDINYSYYESFGRERTEKITVAGIVKQNGDQKA